MFFGLVSRVIHFVSRSGCSSAVVSSFACWAIVFFIRIPTPPPFLFLFFPIHLYPLMLICLFLSSFVSDISAMLALVAFRSDSMLLTLLLMPLTLTVIMVICFFFLILALLYFPGWFRWPSFLAWIILMLVGPNVTFFSFWWAPLLVGGGLVLLVFSLFVLTLVLLASVCLALVCSFLALVFFGSYCVFFLLTSWSWSMILSRLCISSGLLLLDWRL